MSEHTPDTPLTFVVVGHVNRGKSSIVSTLAANDQVRIARDPGTTLHNQAYPMSAGGRTLYTLIDTPGFERARQVLQWLKDHETSTPDRPAVVRRFIEEHKSSGRFDHECELLVPIVEGGVILYVVDGSVPFSPQYEAEMEILRWTARPRMALINTIGSEDHISAWRSVLDQYFSLVRLFDAHDAGFHERIRLLHAIRELHEDWRGPLDAAIDALNIDRASRLADSAAAIAQMLTDLLTHMEEEKLPEDGEPEPYKNPLTERYYRRLRNIEHRCRTDLHEIHGHRKLQVAEAQISAVQDDLFDTDTWSRIGLTQGQLAAAATFSGALAGTVIDGVALGTTGMLGSVIGGVVGGAVGFGSTYFGWRHLEEVKVLGQRFAGKLLRIGPMRNPQFAWVALDRALIYHDLLARRAHAHRDPAELGDYDESRGIVRTLDAATRREIEKCFTKLRHWPPPDVETWRAKLTEILTKLL